MTTSSQQPDSSITLNDTYAIDVSNMSTFTFTNSDTITLTAYSPCTVSYPSSYPTLTTNQISSLTSIDTSAFTFNIPEEWVNCFPDFKRIEKMCEEYPGLKVAYEKFVTTYKLVTDHYDTPEDKRPKP